MIGPFPYTFDFSGYRSNPLASISTALRRFKPSDVETTEIAGVTAYRWKDTKANRKKMVDRQKFDALIKELDEAEAASKASKD